MSLRLLRPAAVLVLVSLLAVSTMAFAQKPSSSPQSTKPAAEPAPAPTTPAPVASKEEQSWFAPLDELLKDAIASGNAPGAVLLVAHNGLVAYRKAYGTRTVGANAEPMTADTIFDLASLTKVIATTTCVMRLEQLGQTCRVVFDRPSGIFHL